MRHRMLSALVALFSLFVIAAPVGAGYGWCQADPIVQLGDRRVEIIIAIPDKYEQRVYDPTYVEIKTAPQITRELLFVDAGFNGKGEVVEFGDLGKGSLTSEPFMVRVEIQVPIKTKDTVPVQVTVIVDGAQPLYFYGTHQDTEFTLWLAR